MPVPNIVYLDQQYAYRQIEEEALRSPGRETGGILVGRMFHTPKGWVLLVVAASGPGPNADRKAYTYAPDVLSRQQALDYWCDHYAVYHVEYVGEWHKHPPGNREPSVGDTRQVQSILTDASYHLPHGIFIPIVTIESNEFCLHPYYYSRETMQPEKISRFELGVGDIMQFLQRFEEIEQSYLSTRDQTGSNSSQSSTSATKPEQKESPDLNEMRREMVTPTTIIIDNGAFVSPHTRSDSQTSSTPIEIPPFPSPPDPGHIPEGTPLPGRQSREQAELKRFCAAKRLQLYTIQQLDDRMVYEVRLPQPISLDTGVLDQPDTYNTPEGTVITDPIATENGVAFIQTITIDVTFDKMSQQLPFIWLNFAHGQRLSVDVAQLFANRQRVSISLRDMLAETIDALQQPKHLKQLPDWIEYHGRLLIRKAEKTTRTFAELLADFNQGYNFCDPADVFRVVQPDAERS